MVCQVLKVGGRFVMVMLTGETRWTTVYNQMKTEERWRDLLGNTRSVCLVTAVTTLIQLDVFQDGERQSRVDVDC